MGNERTMRIENELCSNVKTTTTMNENKSKTKQKQTKLSYIDVAHAVSVPFICLST